MRSTDLGIVYSGFSGIEILEEPAVAQGKPDEYGAQDNEIFWTYGKHRIPCFGNHYPRIWDKVAFSTIRAIEIDVPMCITEYSPYSVHLRRTYRNWKRI